MKMVILFIVLINLVNGQNPDEICYECNTGYYFETADGDNKNKCTKCPSTGDYETCSACSDDKHCTQCATTAVGGYYYTLIEGKCVKCEDTNCVTCSAKGTKKCTKCGTGYTLNDGQCIKCADHCKTDKCTTNGDGKCDECEDGYYLETTSTGEDKNTCKLCSTAKANCATCSSATECTKCASGWTMVYMKEANIYTCAPCPSNCKKCDTNRDKCDSASDCDEGYGLSTNGKCVLCGDNCQDRKCSATGKCNECKPGYYLVPADDSVEADRNTCKACNDANCKTCSSGAADKCSVCAEGWTLIKAANSEEGHCVKCDTNCQKDQCTENGKCKTCAKGFYKVVTPAPSPDPQVADGDETEGTCSPCLANCEECSDGNKCTTCKPKHYKVEGTTDTCNSCTSDNPQNALYACDECTGSMTCTECLATYGGNTVSRKGTLCVTCDNNCNGCSTNGQSHCDPGNCVKGTYYNSELMVCLQCSDGCAECSDGDSCNRCKTDEGYYLDESDHKCKLCNNKNEGSTNNCKKCVKDPEPPAPQDDSSVMVSIVLGLIALIALF